MRKLLLIMRITVILLLSAIHVGAAGYSQNVTLSLKNADLAKAFTEIRKQTGYNFLYNDDWLKEAKKVSITVNNVPLKDALDKCFQDQPFTYTIIEKTISLKLKEVRPLTTDNSKLTIPPIDVHGRVTNETGEPVEGVSVKIIGTDRGTSTNGNGEFTLTNVDDNAILVFTGVNKDS